MFLVSFRWSRTTPANVQRLRSHRSWKQAKPRTVPLPEMRKHWKRSRECCKEHSSISDRWVKALASENPPRGDAIQVFAFQTPGHLLKIGNSVFSPDLKFSPRVWGFRPLDTFLVQGLILEPNGQANPVARAIAARAWLANRRKAIF